MTDVEMGEASDAPEVQETESPAANDNEDVPTAPKEEKSPEQESADKDNEKNESDDKDKNDDNDNDLDDPKLKDADEQVISDKEDSKMNENVVDGDDQDDGEDEPENPNIPPPPSFTRKDKSLKEFLSTLEDNAPIIPDAVTDYYLAKSGFDTSDRRIKRLLALATQKFVSDIASDAYQYSRIRSSSSVASSSNPQARARALMNNPGGQTGSAGGSQARAVLTMEDLGNALADYGLNVKRPDFYR